MLNIRLLRVSLAKAQYHSYIEPKLSFIDYIVFSQSPSFTPASADFIEQVVGDYIDVIL